MGPADDAPSATAMVINGPLARADVPAMLEHIGRLSKDGSTRPIVCDLASVFDPDLVTVDVLATLQLFARRLGRPLCFQHASLKLRELIALAGLSDTLPCRDGLLVEAEGQAEEREEALRVEEEGDATDAPV